MYVTTLNLTFKGHFIVIRKQNSQVREVTCCCLRIQPKLFDTFIRMYPEMVSLFELHLVECKVLF